MRRVFEIFAETGSGAEAVRRLRDEGDVYKLLQSRTSAGEVAGSVAKIAAGRE